MKSFSRALLQLIALTDMASFTHTQAIVRKKELRISLLRRIKEPRGPTFYILQDWTQNTRETYIFFGLTYIWSFVYHISPSTLSYLNFNDLSKHTERVLNVACH